MRWTMFWIVAVAAALWNLFGLFNFAQALLMSEDAMKDMPAEAVAFVNSLPSWRWVSWGAGVAASIAASLALLLRRAEAQHLFWLTVGLMIVGFAYDLLVAAAVRHMGPEYPWFTGALVAAEILFALYARWATRQGMLKRP